MTGIGMKTNEEHPEKMWNFPSNPKKSKDFIANRRHDGMAAPT